MIKFLSIGAFLLLVGCDRSASFYQGHQIERDATVKACADGRTRGRDCDNAAAATASQRHKDAESAFRSGLNAK